MLFDRNAAAAAVLPRAYSFARSLARSSPLLLERLTDAATEAVVRALNSFDEAKGPFEPWARRFVVRAVRKARARFLATLARRPVVESMADGCDPHARPDAGGLSLELRELPPHLLAAVRCYHVEGFTLDDTGKLLGITGKAVAKRLRRAALLMRDRGIPLPLRRRATRPGG